jgi:DNA-binding transcriptional LysR family regulator
MLDPRRMGVLREVARRGSISAAADALNLTASAVSQQVVALEREADVALVDRGPRSLVLTEAGWALVEHAEAVQAQLTSAEAELRAIAGLRGGHLRLGLFASSARLAEQVLRAFHASHPDVRLTLTEAEPDSSLRLVAQGRLDLALVYLHDFAPPQASKAVEVVELATDPVLVALPSTHPLARRERVELLELAGERWITEPPGTIGHRVTEAACRAAGFAPQLELVESGDHRIVQTLVAAGIGVALIPELCRDLDAAVSFAAVDSPGSRTLAAACRTGGRRSPAVAAMLAALAEAVGGDRRH